MFQYATLHTVDKDPKSAGFNLYRQMRMTRKILRFLRTLEYSKKMREEFPVIKSKFEKGDTVKCLLHLLSFLENLFNFLFFVTDHRVCLSELGIISK